MVFINLSSVTIILLSLSSLITEKIPVSQLNGLSAVYIACRMMSPMHVPLKAGVINHCIALTEEQKIDFAATYLIKYH